MGNGNPEIEEIKERHRTEIAEPGSANDMAAEAFPEAVPHNVKAVINCIHEHLYDPRLSVGWMKEQCGINGKNFSGKFKYYVGKTPKEYILYHRIETAKQLLRDEALVGISISTVAYDIGFNSPQAFSTTFKHFTNFSPKAFREEYMNDPGANGKNCRNY